MLRRQSASGPGARNPPGRTGEGGRVMRRISWRKVAARWYSVAAWGATYLTWGL
jgi:hypothetical protein